MGFRPLLARFCHPRRSGRVRRTDGDRILQLAFCDRPGRRILISTWRLVRASVGGPDAPRRCGQLNCRIGMRQKLAPRLIRFCLVNLAPAACHAGLDRQQAPSGLPGRPAGDQQIELLTNSLKPRVDPVDAGNHVGCELPGNVQLILCGAHLDLDGAGR